MPDCSTYFAPEAPRLPDSDAAACLARLHGLFSAEQLNIYGKTPLPGTFPARIQQADFWAYDPAALEHIAYSIVVQSYLGDCLGGGNDDRFAASLRTWVNSFHAARHDPDTARDVLVMFLVHNLESLLHIYILDQADQRATLVSVEAFRLFHSEPDKLAALTGPHFARWVLDDWLPMHLRYYRHLDLQAEADLARVLENIGN